MNNNADHTLDPPVEFLCSDCGESFTRKVWHCPVCDHHWDLGDRECGNCHKVHLDEHNQIRVESGLRGDQPLGG